MGKKSGGAVEWFVAKRLLLSRKRSYVSLVSSVSMWGLALGVASLVVVLSVTTGFEIAFRDKLLGVYPHMVVIGRGGDLPGYRSVVENLKGTEGILSVQPATYDEMMASHKGRQSGAMVKGVVVDSDESKRTLGHFMIDGELDTLNREPKLEELGLDEAKTA